MGETRAGGRIGWIDAAKGLGIIAVATGHVWWRPGPVRDMIYAFHMPLFFILAGYIHRPRPMGEYLRKSLVSLALPYIMFLALAYGVDLLVEGVRGNRPWLSGGDALSKLIFGGSALTGPFTVFWFVPCLFFARLAQNAVCLRFPEPRSLAWHAFVATLVLFCFWTGSWVAHVPAPRTWISPLGLLTVPMALVLLWFGHALGAMRWPQRYGGGWQAWVAIPFALLALGLIASGKLPTMNMKMADYGWPLVSLAVACVISLALFRIADFTPWAIPLGEASLVIMYVHVPIVHYLSPYPARWFHVGSLAGGLMVLLVALAMPYGLYLLFQRGRWTALLFLGKPLKTAAPPPA